MKIIIELIVSGNFPSSALNNLYSAILSTRPNTVIKESLNVDCVYGDVGSSHVRETPSYRLLWWDYASLCTSTTTSITGGTMGKGSTKSRLAQVASVCLGDITEYTTEATKEALT